MENHILIKDVRVIDLGGKFNGKTVSIRVKGGVIDEMGKDLKEGGAEVWSGKGLCASPGWMDGQAHFRDPGLELKEGLERGLDAAAAGGFTDVAILPSTTPVVDNKAHVSSIISRADNCGAVPSVHPLGCISEKRGGKQLAELNDMASVGAIGFSDDAPVERPGLVQRALEYLKPSGDILVVQPLEADINPGATMHEGDVSTAMGLTGSPTEAETMRLKRDLDILKYTGGRLHIPVLSSAEGVKLVKAAKKKGLAVTAATTPHHLVFTEDDLMGFDGTLRVSPPIRSKADRKALLAGVADGTIDAVCSDHRPENLENNDVEFVLSPLGIAGIESVFAALNTAAESTDITRRIDAISNASRRIFNLPEVHLEAGADAKISIFNPKADFKHSEISGGVNDPWRNREGMKGQVYGVVNGNRSFKN